MDVIPPHMRPERSFQGLILALQRYWADYGCVILQPYDMEVGAGTFHPATTLRALGPKRWNAAYVQPSRRPKDGRYGENPNRLQHYYQFQAILKPSPPDLQELYLKSLAAIGIDSALHDIRFVEDDWESPTLGAWGLGWECWCDGMEVSQFTYFQQVAGVECAPVAGELTYGLERLACYLQGVDRIMDLNFNGRDGNERVGYRDVFLQAEQEYSRHNFEYADTVMLFEQFRMAEEACRKYLDAGWKDGRARGASDGAAGLRSVHQGKSRFQPARCTRRDLGDRAAELHLSRARTRQGLRRGLDAHRGRSGLIGILVRRRLLPSPLRGGVGGGGPQTMMNVIESQAMTDRQRQFARQMRAQPTDAERVLWQRLRHDIAPVGSHFRRQAPRGRGAAPACAAPFPRRARLDA